MFRSKFRPSLCHRPRCIVLLFHQPAARLHRMSASFFHTGGVLDLRSEHPGPIKNRTSRCVFRPFLIGEAHRLTICLRSTFQEFTTNVGTPWRCLSFATQLRKHLRGGRLNQPIGWWSHDSSEVKSCLSRFVKVRKRRFRTANSKNLDGFS